MTYQRRSEKKKSRSGLKGPLTFVVGFGALLVAAVGVFLTAAHMEENDAFCASCHSQPEATYVERTQAASPVDLASDHHSKEVVRCIDCHSGSGVIGRMGAMMVGANDLYLWMIGKARQPAPLIVPIADGNCLKCHADAPQTRNFNRHFHAFLSKWQAQDKNAATCVSCHTAHTTTGEVALGYLERQSTLEICQRCHAVLGEGG